VGGDRPLIPALVYMWVTIEYWWNKLIRPSLRVNPNLHGEEPVAIIQNYDTVNLIIYKGHLVSLMKYLFIYLFN
jgi:hypothetical protein